MNAASIRLLLCLISAASGLAGCSVPERSRALDDAHVAGSTLAVQVCASCHGSAGNAIMPTFPNLAGQQKSYLVAQLTAYRAHTRSDADAVSYMWGIAAHLSDAQIQQLADYYAQAIPTHSTRTAAPSPMPATPSTDGVASVAVATGASLFHQGVPTRGIPACAACHGAAGEGSHLFPRLAGQQKAYLIKQLNIFQKTDLRPQGVAMKAVTHALTQPDMRMVSEYISSL